MSKLRISLALLFLAPATPAAAQSFQQNFWVPDGNGYVSSIIPTVGATYVSGIFTRWGPVMGSFVGLDASTGAANAPYAMVEGIVETIAPDGFGGWYIGGSFTSVLGQPRKNLAHLDAAGHLTAWNPNADFTVTHIALDPATDATVYVAGAFTHIGAVAVSSLAAIDTSAGTADPSFQPNPTGGPGIHALVVSGGTIYVGGEFTSIGGQTRHNIAALNASGNATSWDPSTDADVRALAVTRKSTFPFTVTVYAGGLFTQLGLSGRNYIGAVDGGTGLATAWQPITNSWVQCLAVAGSTIYVGGNFTFMGGQSRTRIAALDLSGTATGWDPDADAVPASLVYSGGTLYACGEFSHIGGQPRHHIAAIDGNGNATAWNPDVTRSVLAIAPAGSTIYVGGDFAFFGGVKRNSLVALDPSTGMPTSWDPGLDGGGVSAMAQNGDTIYFAGDFTTFRGQAGFHGLAAMDIATGNPTAWKPDSSLGFPPFMTVSGGTVYVTASRQSPYGITALDGTTGAKKWSAEGSDLVYAIAVSGGLVYVGGEFQAFAGQPRKRLAALDVSSGNLAGWNPGATSSSGDAKVYTLLLDGPTLYVAGDFESVGGRQRSNLAALDALSGVPNTWDPVANRAVFALAKDGNILYAAGFFDTLSGERHFCVGALDVATRLPTAWDPKLDGGVDRFGLTGNTVYLGGGLSGLQGQAHPWFAASSVQVTGVAGPQTPSHSRLLTVSPNPFVGNAGLVFDMPRTEAVEVDVIDAQGRIVRHIHPGILPAGKDALTWNGRDDSGHQMRSGIYFLRLHAHDFDASAKAILLR